MSLEDWQCSLLPDLAPDLNPQPATTVLSRSPASLGTEAIGPSGPDGSDQGAAGEQADQERRAMPEEEDCSKSVLGDSSKAPTPRQLDALGRGRKGYAHGSIATKTCRRHRKSGQVKEYQQAWYQWQDQDGKHCRYLSRRQAEVVQHMLDAGALVPEILEFLGVELERRSSG